MSDQQQQQMIRDAMKSIAERKPGRTKLVYDKTKRTIVAVAEGSQVPRALNITADDADMFAVLTLSSAWLRDNWDRLTSEGHLTLSVSSWDGGDALTQTDLGVAPSASVGSAVISRDGTDTSAQSGIRVALEPEVGSPSRQGTFIAPDQIIYRGTCTRRTNGVDEPLDLFFADVKPELATRRTGILESTILQDKCVLVIGIGTGGAHAAVELAKCGVGKFILVDRDRLSVGNVVRHPGGISQVGRYKVNVVRDLILEKNPAAGVSTYPVEVGYENQDQIRKLIADADIVICGTDNRPSKLLINKLCLEENKTAFYGGAFRRAYGGQVMCVRPRQSPCQQCFVSAMPDEASDVEVSTNSDAEEIAYSDRPVAVEPGLSLDVLPIANMLTKLALLELLADKESSLAILKRDFQAPWYLWLNRPEPGTQYATLPPLSESIDEMTIHRWYGIEFARDPQCPAYGDFLSTLAGHYGLDLGSIQDIPVSPGKDN